MVQQNKVKIKIKKKANEFLCITKKSKKKKKNKQIKKQMQYAKERADAIQEFLQMSKKKLD